MSTSLDTLAAAVADLQRRLDAAERAPRLERASVQVGGEPVTIVQAATTAIDAKAIGDRAAYEAAAAAQEARDAVDGAEAALQGAASAVAEAATATQAARDAVTTAATDAQNKADLAKAAAIAAAASDASTKDSATKAAAIAAAASDAASKDATVIADIVAGSIVAGRVAANAIIADSLAANSVVAGKIAANAVTATTIEADAVTAAAIKAGEVTATHLATDSVTAKAIKAGSVTATALAADSVKAVNIEAGAITGTKIAGDAIDGKTITGATVQTSATGARVVQDTNGLRLIDGSGNTVVNLKTSDGTASIQGELTTGIPGSIRTVTTKVLPAALLGTFGAAKSATLYYMADGSYWALVQNAQDPLNNFNIAYVTTGGQVRNFISFNYNTSAGASTIALSPDGKSRISGLPGPRYFRATAGTTLPPDNYAWGVGDVTVGQGFDVIDSGRDRIIFKQDGIASIHCLFYFADGGRKKLGRILRDNGNDVPAQTPEFGSDRASLAYTAAVFAGEVWEFRPSIAGGGAAVNTTLTAQGTLTPHPL